MSVSTPTRLPRGLSEDNDVLVDWVSSAEPTRISTTRGRVVAVSTETVHLSLASGGLKIINLERITSVTVTGRGQLALRKQAAAVAKLQQAAMALAAGEVVGAQEALACALHFAPELQEDW